MGLRPTQGGENQLKGTAFRPSITVTIVVALAAEGSIFDRGIMGLRPTQGDRAVVSVCAITTKGFPRFAQLIKAVDHGDQLSGFKTFVQGGFVDGNFVKVPAPLSTKLRTLS